MNAQTNRFSAMTQLNAPHFVRAVLAFFAATSFLVTVSRKAASESIFDSVEMESSKIVWRIRFVVADMR